MQLRQHLDHHHAELIFDGEVSIQSASALCRQIQALVTDYRYEHIEVVIPDNPGGQVAAMEMIGRQFKRTQNEGVTVATRGLGTVASAAAITLSRGTLGQRFANEGTLLLYHLGRVQANTSVTAQAARHIGEHLDRLDEQVLHSLVDHILPLAWSAGDVQGIDIPCWRWPLHAIEETPARRFLPEQQTFDAEATCRDHMRRALRTLFEADVCLEPATARSLGLIDQICR